jgi:hypothetical protein
MWAGIKAETLTGMLVMETMLKSARCRVEDLLEEA